MATPILLLAANAPDIDIVTRAGGSLSYLHYHRHLTHSLAMLPVMAILPVLLVRAVARKSVNWGGAIAASAIALLTHLLLDLTNVYGVRLWLPFSGNWLHWDLTSVIDPWIWAVLLFSIAAPFLGGLVGSEITSGSERKRHPGRGFAAFALVFLLAYNLGRTVLHERALSELESRTYADATPLRAAALPDFSNPLRWRGIVETRDLYAVVEVNLTREFDPTTAAIFHKPDPDPALDIARDTPVFQRYLEFSQYPFWRVLPVSEPESGKQVDVMDMRFGTPQEPGFIATAILNNRLQVVKTWFEFGAIKPR